MLQVIPLHNAYTRYFINTSAHSSSMLHKTMFYKPVTFINPCSLYLQLVTQLLLFIPRLVPQIPQTLIHKSVCLVTHKAGNNNQGSLSFCAASRCGQLNAWPVSRWGQPVFWRRLTSWNAWGSCKEAVKQSRKTLTTARALVNSINSSCFIHPTICFFDKVCLSRLTIRSASLIQCRAKTKIGFQSVGSLSLAALSPVTVNIVSQKDVPVLFTRTCDKSLPLSAWTVSNVRVRYYIQADEPSIKLVSTSLFIITIRTAVLNCSGAESTHSFDCRTHLAHSTCHYSHQHLDPIFEKHSIRQVQ